MQVRVQVRDPFDKEADELSSEAFQQALVRASLS
jgi:hypothetical protein